MAGRGAAAWSLSGPTLLNQVATTTGLAAYSTSASITPTANALVLVWVMSSGGNTPFHPNSVTGNGITFAQIAAIRQAAGSRDCSLWAGSAAAPTAGVLNVNFAAGGKTGCALRVEEWTGTTTPAVRQFKTGTDGDATATSGSITLDGSPQATSATIGGFVCLSSGPCVPGGQFTAGFNSGYTTPTVTVLTEHDVTSPGVTVDASWPAAAVWVGIGAEVGAP